MADLGLRIPASTVLVENPAIAVLRAANAGEYGPVIDSLVEGGVRCIELTLSTAGVVEALPELISRVGTDAEIGVGTVTTLAEVEAVIIAGAQFVVTPITDDAIIRFSTSHGIPVFPGGLSPTELLMGWRAGATAVKVFPATTVGPDYVRQLRGPFPFIQVVPSGGVQIDDAGAWIGAGAFAVSLGGPLVGDAFHGGSLAKLTDRARRLMAVVAEAGQARSGR